MRAHWLVRGAALLFALSVVACGDDKTSAPPPASQSGMDAAADFDAAASVDSGRADAARAPSDAGSGDAHAGDGSQRYADGASDESALDSSIVDASVQADAGPGPTVQVAGGTLEGKLAGHTRLFLGIPYASAPVGALRFAPPQPFPAWTGTRAANAYGAVCPQVGSSETVFGLTPLPQSEDCLSLNVFAPDDSDGKPLPVMVFIHGGSGISGTGADYDARALSETAHVVVVTLNYRLGVLASLALPSLDDAISVPSGNLAIRDQQLALTWVRDNIAALGGDAGNVTLFGQSFGSISTCFHMFAKGSEKLAQHFIMESGGCVGSAVCPASRTQMESTSKDLASALCPQAADEAACLRSLTVQQLLDYKNTHSNVLEQFGALYVDGVLMPEHPDKLARAGRFNPASIVLGTNQHEARFLASPAWSASWPLVNSALEFTIVISAMYPDFFADILVHYGIPADADANDTLVTIMDDAWFHCPARALAREVAAHARSAYLYSFELLPAVHTQELDYVFGFQDGRLSKTFVGAPVPPLSDLTRAIQGYWGAFAKTGDPNASGLPTWLKYTRADDNNLALDSTIKVETELDQDACDFWDSVLVEPNLQ